MSNVLEVRARLDQEVAERVARGKCGCGCEEDLPPQRSARTMYVDKKHGHRAYRRRVQECCAAAGQPCRVSLRMVHAPATTFDGVGHRQNGRNVAQKQSKPSGLQVPYRKAVAVLADQLAGKRIPLGRAAARLMIEDALRVALPARQRERLQAGEAREAA